MLLPVIARHRTNAEICMSSRRALLSNALVLAAAGGVAFEAPRPALAASSLAQPIFFATRTGILYFDAPAAASLPPGPLRPSIREMKLVDSFNASSVARYGPVVAQCGTALICHTMPQPCHTRGAGPLAPRPYAQYARATRARAWQVRDAGRRRVPAAPRRLRSPLRAP